MPQHLAFTLFSICLCITLAACDKLKPKVNTLAISHNKPKTEVRRKPNIVLILIDDLSHYGINAYGASKLISLSKDFEGQLSYRTPNIDHLAQQGLRFDHAYSYPLCENTRVALMTGKINDRNFIQPKALHESEITFGDIFQDAGYATGLFGKWKQSRGTATTVATQYLNKFGWQEWAAFDVQEEGQRYINPNLVINGVVHNYQGRTDLDPKTGRRWYGPDIINRYALDFIDRHKDEPFFLYYPMLLVHDDHKPTPSTRPQSIFDTFDEANHNRNGHTGDQRQYFVDMIEYTDLLVGKIIDKLKQHQLQENTLVILVGDNGTKQTFAHVLDNGDVYIGQKGSNADNGIHVPLIMSQPGRIPSAKSAGDYRSYDGLSAVIDILPTMAEAASIELKNKNKIDGISFWQQAIGKQKNEHRNNIVQWFIGNNHYTDSAKVVAYAFDKEAKYYAPSPAFPNGRFFDLREDPFEQRGAKSVELKWGLKQHSGFEVSTLNEQQQFKLNTLKNVLDRYRNKDITNLSLNSRSTELIVGQVQQIEDDFSPKDARRNSVIWRSSAPDIISVDKFGRATALAEGQATITAYSWTNAEPIAAGISPDFNSNSLQAHITLTASRH